MPGRVSTRMSTTSRLSNKASVPAIASRASRTSSPTISIPDEGPSSNLRKQVCAIFADAQRTTAGHRKLVVNLRKIQEACCYEPAQRSKNGWDGFGEDDFNVELARCVIRLMGVRKSEGVGDRIVRFLGLFLQHASEKDAALLPKGDGDETQSFPETPSTRLTSHILSIVLPLLASKEKIVRYRSTQLISHIINSLDSIDDEYYHLIRMGLLKRVRDREAMVRVQAVLGLGRLAGNEGDEDQENTDSDGDDSNGLLEKLLDILQNDTSADVRRSLLLNLPLTPTTLPYLLERARDLDPATRRALYSRLLPALGDFRHLSLSMREKLLRWGLRDRDENVRQATAKLFRERWIEDCAGIPSDTENGTSGKIQPPSIDGLLEMLERIDVVNSGVENGIALEAMKEFWDGRPDYREAVSFDDPYWDHLTPESVFIARTFNDFCRSQGAGKFESLVEDKLPEVTKLAFFLQRCTNNLIDRVRMIHASPEGEEEDAVEQEFIVEQILHIALRLDYSDEVGRRKMFALLRETLAIPELPDEITRLVVEVLRGLCSGESAGEREFCGVVLEAVAEVHDTIVSDDAMAEDIDESFYSAQSEPTGTTPTKNLKSRGPEHGSQNGQQDEAKAIQEIVINMKCLHIAQCLLQNVGDNLQQNVHLMTMLNNLVLPAVRSHEAPIRERGLLCLGLCCLLDKTLAEENLGLFLLCFSKGHDTLQITALHILCDILTTHPGLLALPTADKSQWKPVSKMFSKALKATHTPDVQSAATTALCKLMLTTIIEDEDLLKQLVICYFEPASKENAGVRQALSYFLPVYCHSRRENMEHMSRVTPSIVHSMLSLAEEVEEEEEMVAVGVIANMLIDWTDARKLVVQDGASVSWDEAGKKEVRSVNGDIHLDLAENLLERAMGHGCTKEEKKILISMLGKLFITANSTLEKLQATMDLVVEAIDAKVASDVTSRNSLNKLHSALAKCVGSNGTSRKSMANGETTITVNGVLTPTDEAGKDDFEVQARYSEDEAKMSLAAEGKEEEAIELEKDSLAEDLLDEEEL